MAQLNEREEPSVSCCRGRRGRRSTFEWKTGSQEIRVLERSEERGSS